MILSDIICDLRDEFCLIHKCDYRSINIGQCEDFAILVLDSMPEGECDLMWDDELTTGDYLGHCFIVFKRLYFDSETPNGVNDWRILPCEARYFLR